MIIYHNDLFTGQKHNTSVEMNITSQVYAVGLLVLLQTANMPLLEKKMVLFTYS